MDASTPQNHCRHTDEAHCAHHHRPVSDDMNGFPVSDDMHGFPLFQAGTYQNCEAHERVSAPRSPDHCCTLLCSTAHCCTLLCSTAHCCTLLCSTAHCCTLLCSAAHCRLQALVYDILSSTTAVFSYAIGSRKLSANERFFCWYSNSIKFATNNSDYMRRLFSN